MGVVGHLRQSAVYAAMAGVEDTVSLPSSAFFVAASPAIWQGMITQKLPEDSVTTAGLIPSIRRKVERWSGRRPDTASGREISRATVLPLKR